jgi:Tfp pilus assembly protein PilV
MIRNRRGGMLLEATVAMVILAAAMVAVTQLLATVVRQQQGAARQRVAAQEAANLMERLMARPWHDITTQTAANLALSDWSRQQLPDARLYIDVDELDEQSLVARRVQVEIDWRNQAGQRVQPVRIVAWRYLAAENAEGADG